MDINTAINASGLVNSAYLVQQCLPDDGEVRVHQLTDDLHLQLLLLSAQQAAQQAASRGE